MKIIKNLSLMSLAAVGVYFACHAFIPNREMNQAPGLEDNEIDSARSTENKAWELSRKVASADFSKTDRAATFFSNTYEKVPDAHGRPKLKHGKRYYNEELMDEISTSANLEEIRGDDE